MGDQKPWHESDAFWQMIGPQMFTVERFEKAAAEVDGCLARLGINPPATVLDLACGQGRHCLELARRGFKVTGIDRTREYLNEAQRRANEAGLGVEWVCQDMREFQRKNAFDAAVCFWTSFGYFEDADDDRRTARHVADSLRPGGKFLVELNGKETIARVFQPRRWHELPDGGIMLEEVTVTNDWEGVRTRWITIRGSERTEATFSLRLYSAAEIKTVLLSAGFSRVEAFGNLEGAPYDHQATRLIVVATR